MHGQKEIVERGKDAVRKRITDEDKDAEGIGIGGGGGWPAQGVGKVREDRIKDCVAELCDTDSERHGLQMQFKALDLSIQRDNRPRLRGAPSESKCAKGRQVWAPIRLPLAPCVGVGNVGTGTKLIY